MACSDEEVRSLWGLGGGFEELKRVEQLLRNEMLCKDADPGSSFSPRGPGHIDGGATNALRMGSPAEISNAQPIQVELASGSANLFITPEMTLLSPTEVTPIIPLGGLIKYCGCKLVWTEQEFSLRHPIRGLLPVTPTRLYPMISRALTLELIQELELHIRRTRVRVTVARVAQESAISPSGTLKELLAKCGGDWESESTALLLYTRRMLPGVPEDLFLRIAPTSFHPRCVDADHGGLNRHIRRRLHKSDRLLLHLFSGVQHWKAEGDETVLEIDKDGGRDLLNDDLYAFLLQLVARSVKGVIGGPPRTTFVRARGSAPGPSVLRSTEGAERFGLSGLSPTEQAQVFGDNVLILRMVLLMIVAQEVQCNQCFLMIEHSRDHKQMSPHGPGYICTRLSGHPAIHVSSPNKDWASLSKAMSTFSCTGSSSGSDSSTYGVLAVPPTLDRRPRSSRA